MVFRGSNHSFGGEVDGKYVIVNGIYKLTLDKNYNQVEIFVGEEKKNTFIDYPKLGLPFSQEFSNMVIKNVKWYFEDKKMVLSGKYIPMIIRVWQLGPYLKYAVTAYLNILMKSPILQWMKLLRTSTLTRISTTG